MAIDRRRFLSAAVLGTGTATTAALFGPAAPGLAAHLWGPQRTSESDEQGLIGSSTYGLVSGVLQREPTGDALTVFAPHLNPEPFDLPITPGTTVYRSEVQYSLDGLQAGDVVDIRACVPRAPASGEPTYWTTGVYVNAFFGTVRASAFADGVLSVRMRDNESVSFGVIAARDTQISFSRGPSPAEEADGSAIGQVPLEQNIWLFAAADVRNSSRKSAHRIIA